MLVWLQWSVGFGDRVELVEQRLHPFLLNIQERHESAFALDPRSVGRVDWLFSDVICYPKRLLALIRRWLEAGTVRRFACTIKFQGATDFETMREFAAIPGSQLLHLHHNKHELTWVRL